MEQSSFDPIQLDCDRELMMVSYLIKKPEFFALYIDKLQSEYFFYQPAKDLYKLIKQQYKKHSTVPNKTELASLVYEASVKYEWDQDTTLAETLSSIDIAYDQDVTDTTGGFIVKVIVSKEKEKLASKLANLSPDKVAEAIPELKEEFNELELLANPEGMIDTFFFPFQEKFTKNPLESIRDMYQGDPIPFGINEKLDQDLGGGFYPGEMALIFANQGRRKTQIALNIALNVNMFGKRVIYFALDNPDAEMLSRTFGWVASENIRLCAHESNVISGLLESRLPNYLRKQKYDWRESLCIQPLPAKQIRPIHLRKIIQKIRNYWYKIDKDYLLSEPGDDYSDQLGLIVIDYGDLVLPEISRNRSDEEIEDTFHHFTDIGKQEKTVVLAISQANRQNLNSTYAQEWGIGESYGKLKPASWVGGLSIPEEDNESRDILMVNNIKVRHAENGWMFPLRFDNLSGRIISDPTLPVFLRSSTNRKEKSEYKKDKTDEQVTRSLEKRAKDFNNNMYRKDWENKHRVTNEVSSIGLTGPNLDNI